MDFFICHDKFVSLFTWKPQQHIHHALLGYSHERGVLFGLVIRTIRSLVQPFDPSQLQNRLWEHSQYSFGVPCAICSRRTCRSEGSILSVWCLVNVPCNCVRQIPISNFSVISTIRLTWNIPRSHF